MADTIVCSACLTEACYQGMLMCEDARKAGLRYADAYAQRRKTMADGGKTFYLLLCLECDDPEDPVGALPIPFGSASDRGKWAAEHTRGTGHDRWWVKDETITEQPPATP